MHPGKTSDFNHNGKHVCGHPCFNNYDFHNAIIHLPVASKGNIDYKAPISKRLCRNCAGGDGSGTVLAPYEAMRYYNEVKKSIPNLTVAAISGPGEALADFEAAKNTFLLLRQINPELLLCISTNGLMLPVYANHLISLGVNYVTVTVDTVYPETGAKLYHHITYLGRTYSGVEGANILIQNQISGMNYLASKGVSVRMNIVVRDGINEEEIRDIVLQAKECGCSCTNIIPDTAGGEQDDNGLDSYHSDKHNKIRRECEKLMPQSYFCKPCGVATVETLGTRLFIDPREYLDPQKTDQSFEPAHLRFAVCSRNGTLTDQHFGHANKFYIYDCDDGVITFLETRPARRSAQGMKDEKETERVYQLIKTIEDCNCVICMRIGACPSNALKEKNIAVYTTYNLVEDGIREAVNRLYSGPPVGF